MTQFEIDPSPLETIEATEGWYCIVDGDVSANGSKDVAHVSTLELATLFAASPDMLAALESLLAASEGDLYTDDPDFAPALSNMTAAQLDARAAIAKAKAVQS
jgi:hypothetical protein